MNALTSPLPVELVDTDDFSARDAIKHLVQYHGVCPEKYTLLDRAGLEAKMPHREQALCLDFGFIPLDKEHHYAFGVSYIDEDSSELEGHFPQRKILPAHWILEKMCLACILVSGITPPEGCNPKLIYRPLFWKSTDFSVEISVPPKSILVVGAELLPSSDDDIWNRPIFSTRAFVDGIQCAEATIHAKVSAVRRR